MSSEKNPLHGKTALMQQVREAIGAQQVIWHQEKQYARAQAGGYLLGFIFNTGPIWTGPGYRGEYTCPCGVGHGNHVHGCCGEGCCSREDYPLRAEREELKAAGAEEGDDGE